ERFGEAVGDLVGRPRRTGATAGGVGAGCGQGAGVLHDRERAARRDAVRPGRLRTDPRGARTTPAARAPFAHRSPTVILILSDPRDSHVAPVAAELSRRGAAWTIVDPEGFPSELAMTVSGGSSGERARITWDGGELELSEVRSVWYRRPGTPRLPAEIAPEEGRWLALECDQLLRGCWAALPARWVSAPH